MTDATRELIKGYKIAKPSADGKRVDVASVLKDVMARYPKTMAHLAGR